MNRRKRTHHIEFDNLYQGHHGMAGLEALSMGIPVLAKLEQRVCIAYDNLGEGSPLPFINVKNEDELTLEFFIRKIRNAISHASVEITNDMNFIFHDKDGTQIKYSINGLQTFIRKFTECYMSKKWC